MKIKSIVLTAALATAFSAFSDSVNVDWFTTNATSVVYFDRNINDPVVVTNSVAAPAGFTVAAYAVTAYVTNLVVFAEKPSVDDLKTGAKGAICAACDSGEPAGNKWYGLKDSSGTAEWHELTTTTAPSEGGDYKFRMEFGTSTVTYKVFTISGNTSVATSEALARSGDMNFVPNLYAFAGMGGCTNIVGEIVVTAADTEAVTVSGGKILISEATAYDDVRNYPNNTDLNGLKKWVNYVLGIDAPTATTKPYAAPVQNALANKLDFKLGGVAARNQDTTGAKVTYTIETLASPGATEREGTTGEYGPNDTASVTLEGSGVKYYRIKIKIDPAH